MKIVPEKLEHEKNKKIKIEVGVGIQMWLVFRPVNS